MQKIVKVNAIGVKSNEKTQQDVLKQPASMQQQKPTDATQEVMDPASPTPLPTPPPPPGFD